MHRPGPADEGVLAKVVDALGLSPGEVQRIAVTGGRSRSLPEHWHGVPLLKVPEPEAIGRGGLGLTGLDRALIVSCGTGTAIVTADRTVDGVAGAGRYHHVTGTAVGGGTLLGLAHAMIGVSDPERLAELAASGQASAVDTTLAEVLGGGLGQLPPEATAVNLGRLADLQQPPEPADLAAALVTMVAQVISLLAINAARAHGFSRIVLIGRLPVLMPVRQTLDAVADLYGQPRFLVPEAGAQATALGAALAAAEAGQTAEALTADQGRQD